MRNLLNDVICYGAVWMCVALILLGFVENEIAKRKAEKEKKYNLIKMKAEMYAQRRKEEFEAYREYMEKKWSCIETPNFDELEVVEAEPVELVEGVQSLRDCGSKYVPYDRPNPLDDIRGALSEFTVNDVLSTFYF